MIKSLINRISVLLRGESYERGVWEQAKVDGWNDINYPWRPGAGELDKMGKILGGLGKKGKIALLGSTPEIRNLVMSKNIKLDVVDFSKRMYDEMGIISQSGQNEKFIQSDWIKYFSGQIETYDLVIGDLIERMLPTNKLILLSQGLVGALKRDGRVLLRGDYYIARKNRSATEIKIEIQRLIQKGLNYKEIADWLFFGLSREFKLKSGKVSLAKMKKALVEMNQSMTDEEREVTNLLIKRWTCSPIDFYCRSMENIASVWGQNFVSDVKIEEQMFNGILMALRVWQKK